MPGGFYTNSPTPASNTSINAIASEGTSSPANIDNLIRELAAQGRHFAADIGGAGTVGGSSDAITVTPVAGAIASAFDGLTIGFVATATNSTTSPTANVGGLGSEPIKKAVLGAETALAAGDIRSGGLYQLRWRASWDSSGGAWELLDPYKGELCISETVLASATASTSGTDVEFTSIRAGAKRITVTFSGVSTNGTSALMIQLGKSAGYETNGYDESALTVNDPTAAVITTGSIGFPIAGLEASSDAVSGVATLVHMGSNLWAIHGTTRSNTTYLTTFAGTKSLSGELDRLRVRSFNGVQTFDAGSINIVVE